MGSRRCCFLSGTGCCWAAEAGDSHAELEDMEFVATAKFPRNASQSFVAQLESLHAAHLSHHLAAPNSLRQAPDARAIPPAFFAFLSIHHPLKF